MTLFKTSAATSLAVVIRMAAALVLGKVLAVSVGPSGFAVIGQFQNLMSVAQTLAAGALSQGVTKYTAEDTDFVRRRALWRTAATLSLLGSGGAGLILLALAGPLANVLLFGEGDRGVIAAFAVALLPISLNGLLLAILNGLKEVRLFVIAGIAGSLVTMAFTSLAAWLYGLQGALYAVAVNQAIAFVATVFLCRNQQWFHLASPFGRMDRDIVRKLSGYALMAFVTAFTVPVGQAAVRHLIVEQFGTNYAGYWESVNRLSLMYLAFFTSVLSVYILPKLSEEKNIKKCIKISIDVFVKISPILTIFCASIYLFRLFIIEILFSNEFIKSEELFAFQLLGDFFKISSWIFAYVMIGRAMMRPFIVLELVFGALLVVLSAVFMGIFGFRGASIAYCVNYFLYGLSVVVVLWRTAQYGAAGRII